ncbi:universal stress protein [Acetobacterium paludosum]|uniref:Universal stress protein n=1 Tax=Acetobacterium paludosum TaxID=52693 RepID=A0A923HWQ5_9FIRM|nr:universal stress protein [Acetobacterium paludosum]MBC3888992.1 universal stress protein [Acetobacterium paludosum]
MKKILVPVDGSEISLKAAAQAVRLAEKFSSEVTFLTVVQIDLPYYETAAIPPNYAKMQDELQMAASKESEKILNALVKGYKDTGVVLNKKVLIGTVDVEIEEYARTGGFDLIVMGRRGFSPVKRFFVGSTTKKVLASAPCSVLIVKE